MPQEIPGFYYDVEKNRYFPNRGPVPGSRNSNAAAAAASSSGSQKLNQVVKKCKRGEVKTCKLLQARELCGNIVASGRGRCNFREELQKAQASKPVVWRYKGTQNQGDGALERINTDVQTDVGLTCRNVLLAGGKNGSLSVFDFGKVAPLSDYGRYLQDRVWPVLQESQVESRQAPGRIWRPDPFIRQMPSGISCIKIFGRHGIDTEGYSTQNALVTTLGAEDHGGSVFVINLTEPGPLSFPPTRHNIANFANFSCTFNNCTIWTADCRSDGSHAVIGTNLGASLVDLETGVRSWLLRCKSDVLAQQFVHSGNVVLCGLRNGSIVTVDAREKRERLSVLHASHRIQHSNLESRFGKSSKQWFKLSGNIHPSHTIKMPSSIACLVSLQSDDQYFLASSMDGSVKLYDHRIIQRGSVQTYDGHVNSHTRLQLAVDPSERFFVSGGEDCKLRCWSIKTGELLFEEKLTNTVTSTRSKDFRMIDEVLTMVNIIARGLGLDRQTEYFTWTWDFDCQCCGRVLNIIVRILPCAWVYLLESESFATPCMLTRASKRSMRTKLL